MEGTANGLRETDDDVQMRSYSPSPSETHPVLLQKMTQSCSSSHQNPCSTARPSFITYMKSSCLICARSWVMTTVVLCLPRVFSASKALTGDAASKADVASSMHTQSSTQITNQRKRMKTYQVPVRLDLSTTPSQGPLSPAQPNPNPAENRLIPFPQPPHKLVQHHTPTCLFHLLIRNPS